MAKYILTGPPVFLINREMQIKTIKKTWLPFTKQIMETLMILDVREVECKCEPLRIAGGITDC